MKLNNIRFFTGILFFVAVTIFPGTLRPEQTNPLVRQTIYGSVEGIEANSVFGDEAVKTWAWLGVPYAKPPVGDLRWKAPVSPEKWDGVRPAKKFSDACVQYWGLMSSMDCELQGKLMGSENCLYLNVWRPRTSDEKLPVFFWIHGGANIVGQSAMSVYNGANLAGTQNIIVVSINYRLGPMGWFEHPGIKTGDKLDDSGNFGTLDIIKALEWVRDNISQFGGDPGNVTIAGESAGGVNVYSMMASPLAKGLFHRAISQSGAPLTADPKDGQERAEKVLLDLLVADGTAKTKGEAKTILKSKCRAWIGEYLREKDVGAIFAQYRQLPMGSVDDRNQVLEDGYVIPVKSRKALSSGKYNKVPLLAGSNMEEPKLFLPAFMTELNDEKMCRFAKEIDPDNPKIEIKDYASIFDRMLYPPLTKIGAAGFRKLGVTGPAKSLKKYQDDIYTYRFDWNEEAPPLDYLFGAMHGIELAFMFGNFDLDENSAMRFAWSTENRERRTELSHRMMSYWGNFARTGNPNGANLPEWKRWPDMIILDSRKNP